MVKGIEAAVAKLKEDPEHPVTAEVDGLIIEMRYKGRRTAADVLREIEPLDDESAEEMLRAIREAREEARKLEAAQPTYEQARDRAIARMEQGLPMGVGEWPTWTRDELHER